MSVKHTRMSVKHWVFQFVIQSLQPSSCCTVFMVVFVVGLAERDRPIWACNVHCQMEAQKGNDRSMTPQQTRLLINVILLPYFLACFSMVRASSNNGGCLTIQVLWS